MPEELCPIHGPYDAALGGCPYCSGPPNPDPLDEEAVPTDPGIPGYQAGLNEEDLPTDPGYQGSQHRQQPNEGITDFSRDRPGQQRFDYDQEIDTELGGEARDDKTEPEYIPTGVLGILWVKEGYRRGQIFKIKDGTVIGRKEGSLLLDDPKVSSPHAKFAIKDEQLVITDFLSTNGTFVNGERIKGETPLNENDEIKMGDYVFVYKILPETEM